MPRINNRKYDALAQAFEQLLEQVDEEFDLTHYDEYYNTATHLVSKAHSLVQTSKCRILAKEIVDLGDNAFDNLFVDPNYYGYGSADEMSIRGESYRSAFDQIGNVDHEFYWTELGGYAYWQSKDVARFVQSIKEHMEEGEIPTDLEIINDPSDRPYKDCQWGDETIMAKTEWQRLDQYIDDNGIVIEELSDLMWHDCMGFDRATMLELINRLDTEIHTRWSGEDGSDSCILQRLEHLNDQQPLLALAVADKIETIISNNRLSWDQRFTRCEQALDQAEAVIE